MNPDTYMPFFGKDFFAAVEGYPENLVAAYIRLLWHYWSVNHCEGLRDDDGFLKRICRIDDSDWEQFRPILFGEFFKLCDMDGTWKQKRAREEWEKSCKSYRAKVLGGKHSWKNRQ